MGIMEGFERNWSQPHSQQSVFQLLLGCMRCGRSLPLVLAQEPSKEGHPGILDPWRRDELPKGACWKVIPGRQLAGCF